MTVSDDHLVREIDTRLRNGKINELRIVCGCGHNVTAYYELLARAIDEHAMHVAIEAIKSVEEAVQL